MAAVVSFPHSSLGPAADEERHLMLALTAAKCLYVVDDGSPLVDAIGPLKDVVELARDPRGSLQFRTTAIATAIHLVDTIVGSIDPEVTNGAQ
jgi:hypothetical protein